MDGVPIPVAVAILLDRGRVFLVRRKGRKPFAGHWEFPGGKVKIGEPPVEAVRRELREELDLRVGGLALFGAYSHVYDLPDGPVHYVLIAYRTNVHPGSWSHNGVWVDGDGLKERTILAGSRTILADLIDANLLHRPEQDLRPGP